MNPNDVPEVIYDREAGFALFKGPGGFTQAAISERLAGGIAQALGVPFVVRGRPETCECKTETYCPSHKYRWEYEQDERAAHAALDKRGAPTLDGPWPGDMILSVAGRIARMDDGSCSN